MEDISWSKYLWLETQVGYRLSLRSPRPPSSYAGGDGHNKSDIERSSGRGKNKRNSYSKNFNWKSTQMVEFNWAILWQKGRWPFKRIAVTLIFYCDRYTRPCILCVTHQMSRKKQKDPIGSILRLTHEMMNYKLIPDGTWWCWVSIWRYWLVFGGTGSL